MPQVVSPIMVALITDAAELASKHVRLGLFGMPDDDLSRMIRYAIVLHTIACVAAGGTRYKHGAFVSDYHAQCVGHLRITHAHHLGIPVPSMPGQEDEFPVTVCLHAVPVIPQDAPWRVTVGPCGKPTFRIIGGFPMCEAHWNEFTVSDKAGGSNVGK